MNQQFHHNLTSTDVHTLAINLLLQLPLRAKSSKVSIYDIINVLLFSATWRTSITDACEQLENTPHPSTIRGILSDQLQDLEHTEKLLNDILKILLPARYTKRQRTVAIDLIDLPYHGSVKEQHEDEVRRSKAKSGTTHFFTYATAYMVHKGERYTLAMYRVCKNDTMDMVVGKILNRLKELRINALWFLLDRGFYSVKVINLLEAARKLYIIPIIKQGKTAEKGGPTGTRVFAELKRSCWRRYTMRNKYGETATFEVAVVCRNYNGKWNRHERETLLYATNCKYKKHPDWVREFYRKRFGIESSYRQLNQGRIKTSTRNPVLRLLFVWLALLLRNIWVWLHREVIAERGNGPRKLKPHRMRLSRMLGWLFDEVTKRYPLKREIEAGYCFQRAIMALRLHST